MSTTFKKFIEWAIDIDNSLSKVMEKDTMLTEEERSDLKDIVARHERTQNVPPIERAMFVNYMLNGPILRFTPIEGTDKKLYQYASLSKRYMDTVKDLVVYQGFNGEYYHWISKAALAGKASKMVC